MDESVVYIPLPPKCHNLLLLHLIHDMLPGSCPCVNSWSIFIAKKDWQPPLHDPDVTWEDAVRTVINEVKIMLHVQRPLQVGFGTINNAIAV